MYWNILKTKCLMLIIRHKSNIYCLIQMKHQQFLPSRYVCYSYVASPYICLHCQAPEAGLLRARGSWDLGQSEAMAAEGCTSTTSAVPTAKHRLEGISFLWGRCPCPPIPPLQLHGVTHSWSCCKQEQGSTVLQPTAGAAAWWQGKSQRGGLIPNASE